MNASRRGPTSRPCGLAVQPARRIVATKSTAEWLDFCSEHSIPISEVIELEHLGDDPHFAAVELICTDEHPTEGAYHYVRDPIRIDGTTPPLRRHAPRLGADTDAILSELNDLRNRARLTGRRRQECRERAVG